MEKLIPYEKLSKKKQRERNKEKRGTWGALKPVTRKSENPKAYNRRKARQWMDDHHDVPFPLLSCKFLFLQSMNRRRDPAARFPPRGF